MDIKLVLPIQDHLSFLWIGNGKLLWGSHTFSSSLCSCNGMDSAPYQGWSYDSRQASQRVYLSDCSDWFRSVHVSKPDPTSQNIGTNIGTVEREVYPLFCWIWAKRIQVHSHSQCYLKMKTAQRATELRDGERPGPWTESSKAWSWTYFWIFQSHEPINSFLLYWFDFLLITSNCKFYEDREVVSFVLCHMPCI